MKKYLLTLILLLAVMAAGAQDKKKFSPEK